MSSFTLWEVNKRNKVITDKNTHKPIGPSRGCFIMKKLIRVHWYSWLQKAINYI